MSGLYTAFASQVLFPLHERLKGHATVRVRRQLEQSQWWSAERLRDLQLSRLRDLLGHARIHVPYYRELFASLDWRPEQIASLDDLARLPLLDKATIRTYQDALAADDARDLARFNTGGSSGEPLIFYIGKERVSHDVAAKWRATRWWDVDIGDPEIVLWGSPIELGAQDRIRLWRDRLLRTRLLPAFEMSESSLAEFVVEIQHRRPKMLFGYPSCMALIARYTRKHGIRVDDLGIKVAFVTSERLYDDQRALIEETFACKVANGYGGRDAGFIAHQCPAGGMHLTAEDIIVEIIDGDGRPLPMGSAGEIVVTHLATRDFPFIRYRTGDVGVLSEQPCSCGRGLPLLKEIQGRTTDFIIAQDGTVMHGLALIYVVRDLPGISNFKIIQESLELTRVLLVAEHGLDAAVVAAVQRDIKARLGDSVQVDVEQVERIAAERSGKYRYVVSKVAA